MQSDKTTEYHYRYTFPDGSDVTFEVRLSSVTGEDLRPLPDNIPDWALLSNQQCSHCPLVASEHRYCPAAVSIIDVVDFFREVSSLQPVEVFVTSPERETSKANASISAAISALIGARFAASGCPITAKFQPMVRHHLAFASYEETAYRVVSMYAMAQFLRVREGLEPDWEMVELSQLFHDVNQLNLDFCRRLRDLHVNDSTMNALTGLDSLLQMVDITVDEELIDDFKQLFRSYL